MDIIEGVVGRGGGGEGVGVRSGGERSVDGCFASRGLANVGSAIEERGVSIKRNGGRFQESRTPFEATRKAPNPLDWATKLSNLNKLVKSISVPSLFSSKIDLD